MKKIIALLLALTLCLGMFAGCDGGQQNPSTPVEDNLASAKELLRGMYKDNDGSVVRRDFTRVAAVMVDGVSYPITWTVDSADVTVGAAENGMVKIDINEAPAEDVTFVLTGTITDADGKTATVTFTHYIEAPEASGTVFVDAPVAGTAYKFALVQNNLGQTLYFTGEMSGFYLAMSESPFEAVDVFVEDVDGGQRIYFMAGETKTYIDVVPRGEDQPGKVNVVLTAEPTCVYTWDAERKTYTTTVADNTWYLGTYNTYNTISASNTSYIENLEVIGATQFPAGFCTVNIAATQVATPAVDTAYKFAVVQNNLGQTLYFTGAMNGFYLGTSVNPAEGINVFVENVDGGQRIYFMAGETKTYIDVVPRGEDQPGKVNVVLTEEPTCVFTWDAERKTYTTSVVENTWYLGCYNTYNTMSASNTSYIENMEVIGATQFPAGMYTVDGFMDQQPDLGGSTEPEEPEKPETTDPAADSTLSIKDAVALGTSKEHNVYTEGKYYITGTIKELKSDVYGNMIIVDADGNEILVYGTYDADGTNRYDAMATKPVVGDTVTVYGIIGQYNGTAQMKNGWITAHTAAGGNTEPTDPPATEPAPTDPPATEPAPTDPPATEPSKPVTGDPEANSTLSIADAIALGASKEHNTYTEGKYYVTGVITEVYNTQYGNMKIKDEAGNILTVYGTYSADGADRYDALATKPVAGDTVTIYGIIGQYNGTPQIKNGWITAHTPGAGSSEPTEPVEKPSATDVTLTNGMKVVIYAPAHGKALSSKPSSEGSFYQMGVDVTMSNGTLTGYAETEIWTVVVNDDGSVSFQQNGKNLGMQDQYSSMSLGAANDDWTVISLGDGLYLIKNVVRENCIEWYSSKNNWSTYTTTADAGNDLFHMAFFVVE